MLIPFYNRPDTESRTMRTSDIKAGVPHATCDGEYIVPVEPVKSTYQYLMVPKEDGSGQRREVIDTAVPTDPENPWGKCHVEKPEGSYRTGHKGVKVLAYKHVDAEGNPLGDPVEGVVRPRDIGGTWKEYMTLYAHVVKANADERALKQLVESTHAAMAEAMSLPEGAPLQTGWSYSKPWRQKEKGQWTLTITVPLDDHERFEDHDKAVGLAQALTNTAREYFSVWGH